MKRLYLFVFAFAFALPLWAQTDAQPEPDGGAVDTPVDILERVAIDNANTSGELRDNTFFDNLERLQRQPIDLNTATTSDLLPLLETGMMTDLQAVQLIAYRTKAGAFISTNELQAIDDWDIGTVYRLLPYFVVRSKNATDIGNRHTSVLPALKEGKHSLNIRFGRTLEASRGYDTTKTTRYLGDPNALSFRYRFDDRRHVQFGVTADKDAGEEFFKGSNRRGFDFYSAHVFLRRLSPIVTDIALGDYEIRFGQGLIQWAGLSYSKTSDIFSIKKTARPLTPFTSLNEVSYLRGAAANFAFGKAITATAFASYRFRDANVLGIASADSLALAAGADGLNVSSFGTSGLHRTETEIARRNATNIITVGGRVGYNAGKLNVNANVVYNAFEHLYNPTYAPYNAFYFRGNTLANGSLDYTYTWRNAQLFGETAISGNGGAGVGVATLNGAFISLARTVSAAVLVRHYDRNYNALQNAAFGDDRTARNEDGVYFGVRMTLPRGYMVQAYADGWQHAWLRYLVDAPSVGRDYMTQLTRTVSATTEWHVRYRDEYREANPTPAPANPLLTLVGTRKRSARFNIRYQPLPNLTLQNRVEALWLTNERQTKTGYLVYQDVRWKLPFEGLPKISIAGRFAVFNTDDYESRIYAFENSVATVAAVPSFYYKGFHTSVVVAAQPAKHLSVSASVSYTVYDNRATVGTYLDAIAADHRTDVRVQVRYDF